MINLEFAPHVSPENHRPVLVCGFERQWKRHEYAETRPRIGGAVMGREFLFKCSSCGASRVWGAE